MTSAAFNRAVERNFKFALAVLQHAVAAAFSNLKVIFHMLTILYFKLLIRPLNSIY